MGNSVCSGVKVIRSADKMPFGLTGESHPEIYERFPRSSPLKDGQLTDEQLEAYFRDGYIIVKDFFSPEELDPLLDSINDLVGAIADKLFDAGKISRKYEEEDVFHRLIKLEKEFPGTIILLHKTEALPESFTRIAEHPRVLNLLEDFLGPDISFSPMWNLRTKTPRTTYFNAPWHQDNAYMDKNCYKMNLMTAWIPLMSATKDNGTLEFIRGTHKSARVAKHSCCSGPMWYVMMDEETIEKDLGGDISNDSFVLDVPYGSFILFNNFTVHRSLDNVSDIIRWTIDFRWQKANLPGGFYGLKEPILLRSQAQPNLKPDWDAFNAVARHEAQRLAMKKEDKEFSRIVTGPWMRSWPIVHHNLHTAAFMDEEEKHRPNGH